MDMKFNLLDDDGEVVNNISEEQSQDTVEDTNEVIEESIEQDDEVINESDVDDVVDEDEEYEYIDLETNEDVIEYIKDNEEILSQLNSKEQRELPEDIQRYLEFKEETNGRSLSDFLSYQQDFSEMDSEEKVKRYIAERNPMFSEEDIDDEYSDRFTFEEGIDNDSEIKRKQRELKRITLEADNHFEEQKEKWGEPLGSDDSNIPEEYVQSKQELDEIRQQEASMLEENEDKSTYFMEQTESLFNDDFKGFDFQIGDETFTHEISNTKDVIESQSNLSNFFSQFIDEDGYIKDTEGYHKALYMAMNYESVIKNVRDTAISRHIEDEAKSSRNIDMGKARRSPETIKTGTKFKIIS